MSCKKKRSERWSTNAQHRATGLGVRNDKWVVKKSEWPGRAAGLWENFPKVAHSPWRTLMLTVSFCITSRQPCLQGTFPCGNTTAWFNFSEPYLHTFTSPFPRIKMVRGGHRRHIPEPVKGIFCYHVSSNVLKRHIDPVYLALVYITNKHMPELQREPSCSIVSQSAVMTADCSYWEEKKQGFIRILYALGLKLSFIYHTETECFRFYMSEAVQKSFINSCPSKAYTCKRHPWRRRPTWDLCSDGSSRSWEFQNSFTSTKPQL